MLATKSMQPLDGLTLVLLRECFVSRTLQLLLGQNMYILLFSGHLKKDSLIGDI